MRGLCEKHSRKKSMISGYLAAECDQLSNPNIPSPQWIPSLRYYASEAWAFLGFRRSWRCLGDSVEIRRSLACGDCNTWQLFLSISLPFSLLFSAGVFTPMDLGVLGNFLGSSQKRWKRNHWKKFLIAWHLMRSFWYILQQNLREKCQEDF